MSSGCLQNKQHQLVYLTTMAEIAVETLWKEILARVKTRELYLEHKLLLILRIEYTKKLNLYPIYTQHQ